MPYRIDRVALAAPALEAIAARRVRDGRAPSAAWALLSPDGVVADGRAGDGPAGGDPAGAAFRVASCTKSVTAALMLVLRDGGVVDLDAPVDALLTMRALGASRAPSLRELATHTGGIPVDDPWADRQESMPVADLDARLADGVRLVREPGTRYEYSSYGYAILGRALERAAGGAYLDLVGERLLGPLAIPGLGFERPASVVPGFARVEGTWAEQPWADPGAFSPLGGLIATPRGLAGWAGWLAAAWRPGAGDAVLAAASRLEMQQAHALVPGPAGHAYGFGLVVEQDRRHGRIVGHSGGYPGYGANMRWHAESGVGVVWLENARYSGATAPAAEALVAVLDAAVVPEKVPELWPETGAARDLVERLVRGADEWDAAAFADNVALDTAPAMRRAAIERLAAAIGPLPPAAPLGDAAPLSDSAAHLVWSVPGATGSLRCTLRMTPEAAPRIQTLEVRLG